MIVANRTLPRAQQLAAEFKGFAIGIDDIEARRSTREEASEPSSQDHRRALPRVEAQDYGAGAGDASGDR